MSDVYVITIKRGYSDGTLKLSDRELEAKKKNVIVWTIKDDARDVNSIELIDKKAGSPEIFIHPPVAICGVWIAEINHNVPDNTIYEYFIKWNGTWGPKTFDPKISIKPSGFNFIKLIIGIILGLLGLLSLKFLSRKEKE